MKKETIYGITIAGVGLIMVGGRGDAQLLVAIGWIIAIPFGIASFFVSKNKEDD